MNMMASELYNKKILDSIDSRTDTLNFRNGILELRTSEFRERVKEDYVSQFNNWDFSKKADKKKSKFVNDLLLKIFNCSQEDKDAGLSMHAYQLTGDTSLQLFAMLYGSGGNAKSTILEILDLMFPIHFLKISAKTFNEDYQKAHKSLGRIEKNHRCVYIEELKNKKLDVGLLKDFVSGGKINMEIMFSTSRDIFLRCKLLLISNNLIKIDVDGGIDRRGWLIELCNKFCSEANYDKEKQYESSDRKVFKADLSLKQKFENDSYKLAFLHILMPYIKKFYDTKSLMNMKQRTEAWRNSLADDNKFQEFLNDNYTITEDSSDRVSKKALTDAYNAYYKNDFNVSQTTIRTWAKLCHIEVTLPLKGPIRLEMLKEYS